MKERSRAMIGAMSAIDDLLQAIPIPRMVPVRQKFEDNSLNDWNGSLVDRIRENESFQRIKPGSRIAITAGSRGIAGLPEILRLITEEILSAGANPFIIPAMGSHGGATAKGQEALLEHMGITEQSVGAPVKSTMDVVQIGTSASGLPVYMDRYAFDADGVVVVNRIKPHVAFRGNYESGLMKMIAIGLGKQKGAETCHDLGLGVMARNIEEISHVAVQSGKILFGVGIIENAFHKAAEIHVLSAADIEKREPELLERAWGNAPRLYFSNLDVLIIDEIGKDISGTGFDNNVVGRYHTPYASGGPNITRIAALDITERSGGNGNGLGILDFTTRRAFDKFNFEQTYPNSLTSTVPMSVKIPMVLKNDRQAIQAAIKTCNIQKKEDVRLVRIRNTLSLQKIEASLSLVPEINENPNLWIESSDYIFAFNNEGNLF
jgi:hypothetical protein